MPLVRLSCRDLSTIARALPRAVPSYNADGYTYLAQAAERVAKRFDALEMKHVDGHCAHMDAVDSIAEAMGLTRDDPSLAHLGPHWKE